MCVLIAAFQTFSHSPALPRRDYIRHRDPPGTADRSPGLTLSSGRCSAFHPTLSFTAGARKYSRGEQEREGTRELWITQSSGPHRHPSQYARVLRASLIRGEKWAQISASAVRSFPVLSPVPVTRLKEIHSTQKSFTGPFSVSDEGHLRIALDLCRV